MHPIKKALYDAFASNDRLVRLLGSKDAISSAWPSAEARYTDSSLGSDYTNLPLVDPPRARLTYRLVVPHVDIALPMRDDVFQVDVWSPNEELAEEVVAELESTYNQKPLTLTISTGRITEVLFQRGPDLYETDTRINHTPNNLRVLWNP